MWSNIIDLVVDLTSGPGDGIGDKTNRQVLRKEELVLSGVMKNRIHRELENQG